MDAEIRQRVIEWTLLRNRNEKVVYMDTLMEWMGLRQRDKAKTKLLRYFRPDIDYVVQEDTNRGCYEYLLTVPAAKRYLMTAKGQKAHAIYSYFVEAEEQLLAILASTSAKETKALALAKAIATPNTAVEQTELEVRNKLAAAIGGQVEVAVEEGLADIVTEEEVIEVKAFSKWKHALGQVLAYDYSIRKQKRRIHLFGEEASPSLLPRICECCSHYGVLVTYEQI